MRVFIVRPFSVKEGIDFDRVEADLIQPALRRLGELGFSVSGGTTGEISRQGNIREDMFRLLVVSDLVIADVSIHNANAFYELGIRHALRPRHTFLIRSETPHRYPFDLQTDRYFLYDAARPADRVESLAEALRSTLASSAERDSPVFRLLPSLKPHGRGQLVKVPSDFQEDVERARRDGRRGDLRLLADEVQFFEWDQEGLQMVGEAQFKLRAFAGARETFEALRQSAPDDLLANLRLGTIYQRLTLTEPSERKEELLALSDQAIHRAQKAATSRGQRAETHALLGSNAKSRWLDDFRSASGEARARKALTSAHFGRMLDHYLKAYSLDLNAHYPGVNALALLRAQIALAQAAPEEWRSTFDDDEEATSDLRARETLASRLTGALTLALEMDAVAGKRDDDRDPWAASSRADLLLLTTANRPERVAKAYREALAGADRFALEATRRNLAVFRDLALFEPGLSEALEAVDEAIRATDPPRPVPARVILFTGHMVDAPDRPKDKARFPRTDRAEATARRLIEGAVRSELATTPEGTLGIAGGACGGDILFHEVCRDLGVRTELLLALPREGFQVTSVQRGGARWVERYQTLCEALVPRVLQPSTALPRWLADRAGYDVWLRNNFWLMFSALATGARRLTLVALYNPERDADGPGGTRHLVEEARKWGFKSVELDARELLDE